MNKKKISLIISVVTILFAIVYYFCYFNYNNINVDENVTKPVINENMELPEVENKYKEENDSLRKEYNNDEIVGILSIPNTSFYEIVAQTTDNDYYLSHSLYKESDWRGQTFLDYRFDINNSDKLIIYGHNAPSTQVPFKMLENYQNSNYLKEHKYISLQTDKELKTYEIFSVYIEVSDWSYFSKTNFNSKEEYYNHILKLKSNSFYETGVEVSEDDDILILQTCSYDKNYQNYENKFLLIIAKEIPKIDK